MLASVGYLLQPSYMPFTVALGLMVGLFVLELVGLGVSTLTDALELDGGLEYDQYGPEGELNLLSWLGVGRVPMGVLLVTLLLLYGLLGVALQTFCTRAWGGPLHTPTAALGLAPVALVANGLLARVLARWMPQDETTAVSTDTFLGKRARMLDSPALPGSPARAEYYDVHGQSHYVSVLPHASMDRLLAGEQVLLVARQGVQFYAIAPDRMPLD